MPGFHFFPELVGKACLFVRLWNEVKLEDWGLYSSNRIDETKSWKSIFNEASTTRPWNVNELRETRGMKDRHEINVSVIDGVATIPVVSLSATVNVVEVWTTASFAQTWFEEACAEARLEDRQARRREIVFSVCCAESYLFEWVRDEILKGDYSKLEEFFPHGRKRGLRERWREVRRRLIAEGLIQSTPDFEGSHAEDWNTLITFRDGLVHGAASRPYSSLKQKLKAVPQIAELDSLPPGWAVEVIRERFKRLNLAGNTITPAWLSEITSWNSSRSSSS